MRTKPSEKHGKIVYSKGPYKIVEMRTYKSQPGTKKRLITETYLKIVEGKKFVQRLKSVDEGRQLIDSLID